MKKFWYVFVLVFAVMLIACENSPAHHYDDDDDDDKPSGGGGKDTTASGISELTPEGDKTLLWPAMDTTNNLYGYINEKGEFAIPGEYARAYGFSCGLAYVLLDNGSWAFINTDNLKRLRGDAPLWVEKPYFIYNRLRYMGNNGHYGIMENQTFSSVITPDEAYEQVGNPTADGLIMYRKYIAGTDVRYGYKDLDGNEALPIRYTSASDFVCGMALVGIQDSLGGDDLFAVIDTKGNYVIEPSPVHIMYVPVEKNVFLLWDPTQSTVSMVTKEGNVLADGIIETRSTFQYGLMLIKKADSQWYFIDREGHVVLGPYADARAFFDGLAWTKTLDSAPWKALDKDGKEVMVLNDTIDATTGTHYYVEPETDFHNGLVLVKNVQPMFTQYWYLNKEGEIVYYWLLDKSK